MSDFQGTIRAIVIGTIAGAVIGLSLWFAVVIAGQQYGLQQDFIVDPSFDHLLILVVIGAVIGFAAGLFRETVFVSGIGLIIGSLVFFPIAGGAMGGAMGAAVWIAAGFFLNRFIPPTWGYALYENMTTFVIVGAVVGFIGGVIFAGLTITAFIQELRIPD